MKKNIWALPTNKPSRLSYDIDDKEIYITSNEKPKAGDWFITKNGLKDKVLIEFKWHSENSKKIVLTTDIYLIKEGVQIIDDYFLEWFVKNPNCECVEVLKNPFYEQSNYEYYKIIIPKEEHTPDNKDFLQQLKEYFKNTPRDKVLEDWAKSAEFDNVGPTVDDFIAESRTHRIFKLSNDIDRKYIEFSNDHDLYSPNITTQNIFESFIFRQLAELKLNIIELTNKNNEI